MHLLYCPLLIGYSQVYMSKAFVHAHTYSGMLFISDKLLWPSRLQSRVPEFVDEWLDDMVVWRVCVWRMIALYISTSFSTSSSFWRYYIPYRPSMRERERKERRKRKEKWTRLALIREVFAEVEVVGVLCLPQTNKRLRNCLFMQIIQNNKLLAGKASTTVTSS